MSRVLIAVLAIIGVAASVTKAVMGSMLREETQTRLSRIPFVLIRLAIARAPRELRDDLAEEWQAELEFVLTGTEGMPITRLVRGIRYSAGLLVSARDITDGLTHGRVGAGRLICCAVGTAVGALGFIGIVTAITQTEPALGMTAAIGQTCMAASFVIGAFTLITWKLTRFRVTCGLSLAIVANIAFYLHGHDHMNLIWAVSYLLFLLVAAAFRHMLRQDERGWRQELRALHAVLYPDCTECLGPAALPDTFRDLDETRYKLVSTIVNALAHHQSGADPEAVMRHVATVVNGGPGDPGESKAWLRGHIERMKVQLDPADPSV